MGRGPNSRPDKGFTRELASKPEAPKAKAQFTYNKPVSKVQPVTNLNTPTRMAKNLATKPKRDASNLVAETTQHQKLKGK